MKFPWYIWIARILIMLLILFMGLFSLDVFEGNATIWNKLLGFLIHNVFGIVLLLVLIFTWKHPLIAGIIFLVINAALAVFFAFYKRIDTFLSFSLPPLIAVVFFVLAHGMRKNEMQNPQKTPASED